jgi:hypothetical protein
MKARSLASALILSTLLLGAGARAVQVVGGPAPQSQRPAFDTQSASAAGDESNALATGVIDSVDAAAGRAVINGVPLQFDPAAVQVFSTQGMTLSPFALRMHQNVGFLLDGKDPKHSTVRVFYLR